MPAHEQLSALDVVAHSVPLAARTASATYESLADPKWQDKVCIRAGQHPYNTALIAAHIAHHGEARTETWLRGIKANCS